MDDAALGFSARDYEHGGCDYCACPLNEEYDCPRCEPRVALEDTPILASFALSDGRVALAGWSDPRLWLPLYIAGLQDIVRLTEETYQ